MTTIHTLLGGERFDVLCGVTQSAAYQLRGKLERATFELDNMTLEIMRMDATYAVRVHVADEIITSGAITGGQVVETVSRMTGMVLPC